jgi:uncharacterized protein (DUF433 family)
MTAAATRALLENYVNGRITSNPGICHGKPCIRGLRYPVESVLEWLASGMTIEDILSDYEDLEREDILAVLAYAARLAHVKRSERLAASWSPRMTISCSLFC